MSMLPAFLMGFPPLLPDKIMDKSDIIWWPDDKKGLIINAVTARDRASLRFVGSRAARILFPLPLMVLASFWISSTLEFPPDTPSWVLTWIEWGPSTLFLISAVMSVIVGIGLLIDWRKDQKEAAGLEQDARAIGVDVAKLDSDWVFEALVMPMVRRKGIRLPDGTVAHLQKE
jgi:hypothetical protein